MATYSQYCPIAKAVEVVGERWSILIIREMLIGAGRFNEIARGLPGISRSLLSKRLKQLDASGLIEHNDGLYRLTASGHELAPLIFGLGDWAEKWILTDPEPEEMDPTLLIWWGHSRLRTWLLPPGRNVLEFRFSDDERRYWLVVEPEGTSICEEDPGFGVDAVVETDVRTLHRLWNGRIAFQDALRDRLVRLGGHTALQKVLPEVLSIITLGEMSEAARTH